MKCLKNLGTAIFVGRLKRTTKTEHKVKCQFVVFFIGMFILTATLPAVSFTTSVLVVGGGGGGGYNSGGGGGGGDVEYSPSLVLGGTSYAVTVGGGGTADCSKSA